MRELQSVKLKSPKFGERMRESCDLSAECPPLHKGRLVWLKERLAERGLKVSIESIRKWVSGDGRARQDTCNELATILGVDPVWLYMGDQRTAVRPRAAPQSNSQRISRECSSLPIIPIAIRPETIIEVRNVPIDLTKGEAQKIANVILAHAAD